MRALAAEIDRWCSETLHHDESERFELDVYLGKRPGELTRRSPSSCSRRCGAAAARAVRPRRRTLAPRCVAGHRPCRHAGAEPRRSCSRRSRRSSAKSRAVSARRARKRAAASGDPLGPERTAQALQRGGAAAVRGDGAARGIGGGADRPRRTGAPARVRRPLQPRRPRVAASSTSSCAAPNRSACRSSTIRSPSSSAGTRCTCSELMSRHRIAKPTHADRAPRATSTRSFRRSGCRACSSCRTAASGSTW